MTPSLSPIEHFLPSLFAFLLLLLRLTERKETLECRTASARPLRVLTRSHAPESHQKATGRAACYANKGEDKSTAPAEESGDGIMITN